MIKAGIMSMQRILNYGSFLQAYALMEILSDLGCNVEFVDYHVGGCLIDSKNSGLKRKLNKAADTFKIKAHLKDKIKFVKYKKNFAKNYHSYLGLQNEHNYNPLLDVLIIGSDEVFNCIQDNPNVGFSPELFGANNGAQKLVSYAASFGGTTKEKMKECGIYDEIKDYLLRFDRISVRDRNSYDIICEMTCEKPERHLDPVLIYDFIGKCDLAPAISSDNYLILYGYNGRFSLEECKRIKYFAKRRKLKIYCIGGLQHCCDKFIDCSPFEVIAYFKNADFVVSDTFHGTILSVITHKNFVTVIREGLKGNSQKLTSLLEDLNLKDRLLLKEENLEKILTSDIDYESVDKVLQRERQRTEEYLKMCLNEAEKYKGNK